MPSYNDPVKPTPFDAVQPAPAAASSVRSAESEVHHGTPRWVWPALGGLLLLAVLVFFWLPTSLDRTGPAPAQTDPESPVTATPGQAETAQDNIKADNLNAAPWSDAQLAHQRKEAQEVAAELLDLQLELQKQGVEQWAQTAFAEATTFASEGDAHYKKREFEEATTRYRLGLVALQELQAATPEELQKRLAQARQALEDGDATAAQDALDVAAAIDPDNTDIKILQQRTEVLPQLLPLLEQAEAAEAAGDLATAQQLLQQATALDSQHQRARSELQRVATEVRNRDFNKAMSEGYAALDEGRFDSARKLFRSAASLQKGSPEAASALQEVAAAETAQRLATLDRNGRQYEQGEQWQKAVAAYEQAQKMDGSVLFASEGLRRSRARAQLDQQFRKTIEQPQRLSDAAVAKAAEQLLVEAQQVSPRGPVMEQQISQLDTLLRQANATVHVTLRSDRETEVIVYKVARLGRFSEHELALRPGTYTALGTRDGYRDVRRTFTVTTDGSPVPVTIVCNEPI